MTKWNEDQEKWIARHEAELKFTDRDSYLAWRDKWRSEYSTLSRKIRELRIARDFSQKNWLSSNAATQMLIREASKRKAGKQRAAALAEKAAA